MTGGRAAAGEPFYDLGEDWELVEASFLSAYGIRLSRELADMKWREFTALLSALDGDTPLGRIAAIRAEDDPERLRRFTPAMRQIRSRWRSRRAAAMAPKDVDGFLEEMKRAFLSMA